MPKAEKVIVFGEERTYSELETEYGINRCTIRARVLSGIPPEDAVLLASRGPQPTEVFGKTYPTLAAVAKHFDISTHTLAARMRRGVPIEEAVTGIRSCSPVEVKRYPYRGERLSAFALARIAGVTVQAMQRRLRSGMPVEEALHKDRDLKLWAARFTEQHKFLFLTVVLPMEFRKRGSKKYTEVLCRCACGKTLFVKCTDLWGESVKACGRKCSVRREHYAKRYVTVLGKRLSWSKAAYLFGVRYDFLVRRMKKRGLPPLAALSLSTTALLRMKYSAQLFLTWEEECTKRGLNPNKEDIEVRSSTNWHLEGKSWWEERSTEEPYETKGTIPFLRNCGCAEDLMLTWVLAYIGRKDSRTYKDHPRLQKALKGRDLSFCTIWHSNTTILLPDTNFLREKQRVRLGRPPPLIKNLYQFMCEVVECRYHTMKQYQPTLLKRE